MCPSDKDEKDEYWDISRLLPKKTPSALSRTPAAPHICEIVLDETAGNENAGNEVKASRIPPRSEENDVTDEFEYVPEGNPFIRSVKVTRLNGKASFYARFRDNARRYFAEEGKPDTPYTPFFSYIPQYGQLTSEQQAYYFTFRSAVRRKEPIKTDFSYLMLLVYEILNIPDLLPPEKGIDMLSYLFCTYRGEFPQLDKYLAVWIPDYCLMHRLPCPTSTLSPILPYVLAAANCKEFYLGEAAEMTPVGVHEFCSLVSDYHWQYSRYAAGETEPVFRKHMGVLLPIIIRALLGDENTVIAAGESVRDSDVFSGSLSAHNIRCHLHIVYCPFAHTPGLRRVLTQSVKYAENKIRALLSVRSRLSVGELPPKYRNLIDAYFADFSAKEKALKKKDEAALRPAYEALYDAVSPLSLDDAARIERESWETTAALLPDEELVCKSESDTVTSTEENGDAEVSDVSDTPVRRYGLSDAAFTYLTALAKGDVKSAAAFAGNAFTADTLAEEINTAFADNFGDIILEAADSGYRLMKDYESEVLEWIAKQN